MQVCTNYNYRDLYSSNALFGLKNCKNIKFVFNIVCQLPKCLCLIECTSTKTLHVQAQHNNFDPGMYI